MLQQTIRLDENVSQKELSDVIVNLNLDPEVDGILVQMPLPEHLDETAVLELIDPQKDVIATPYECRVFINKSTWIYSLYTTRCHGNVRFNWL